MRRIRDEKDTVLSVDKAGNYGVSHKDIDIYMVKKDSMIGKKIWEQVLDTGTQGPRYTVYESDSQRDLWTYSLKKKRAKGIPSGAYKLHSINFEQKLEPIKVDSTSKRVEVDTDLTTELRSFLRNKKLYDKIGSLYKRGYLLYGPPGTGKSTLVQQIVEEVIPKDSIIMYCAEVPDIALGNILKDDERLKVFIFEELTQIKDAQTDDFLNFLDGGESVDHSLFIATTNYPAHLPANIIERPGRFDVIRRVDIMPEKVYKALVELYCKDAWDILKDRDYLTTAQLRELGLKCALNKITPTESLALLMKMTEDAKKEFDTTKSTKMGF